MDKVFKEVCLLIRGKTVIAGIGNVDKADDAAGVLVVGNLKDVVNRQDVLFIDAGIAPENYLEKIAGFCPDSVIFIDAVDFGEKPGYVHVVKAEELSSAGISTHAYSLSVIAEYLKTRINVELHLIGIQPKILTIGACVSDEVKRSVRVLSEGIACHCEERLL